MTTPAPTVDAESVTDFALRLVAVRSLSGQEAAVAAVLQAELDSLGFSTATDRLGNVVGTLELGPGPTVLFDAHLDTVPVADAGRWTRRPDGELADGRLFGRGAVDTKGPMAACVHGLASLRGQGHAGHVVVSATIAEELVEGPALEQVVRQVRPDVVVICEPSSGRLATGQRGRAEIVVTVRGRSSHSAYPMAGRNAVEAMADVVTALRTVPMPPADPVLGPGLLVLTDIISRPYPSLSVVPDECVATFDRRTLPGETQEEVLAPLRAVADRVAAEHDVAVDVAVATDDFATYTGVSLSEPNFAAGWTVPRESLLVGAALDALAAAGVRSEASHFAFCTNGSGSAGVLGVPTLGYGPGSEDAAHTADESIAITDLVAGARGYAALASALLSLDVDALAATPVRGPGPVTVP